LGHFQIEGEVALRFVLMVFLGFAEESVGKSVAPQARGEVKKK
jgi:hypothetical protein